MTQHTKTPWVVHEDGRSIEALNQPGNLPLITVCTFPNPPFDRDAANAAFIVRACNAHEELVEALESLAAAYLENKPASESLRKATRIIKKVKGEA